MQAPSKHILITGVPGCGKTTLIRGLVDRLSPMHPVGFYTAEIRERGARRGFELVSLDGRRQLLSHTDIDSPHRVGKYRVDVDGFESFLDGFDWSAPETGLIIIDEIGKMECLSQRFGELLKSLFASPRPLLASVSLGGGGAMAAARTRPDATLLELTHRNRESLADDIVGMFT